MVEPSTKPKTCPKCGQPFYGSGCPECDFPHPPPTASQLRMQRFIQSRTYAVAIALLLAAFSWLCFYAALSPGRWSGLPLLPPSWNDKIGRGLAGFMGCVCAVYALGTLFWAVKKRNGAKR